MTPLLLLVLRIEDSWLIVLAGLLMCLLAFLMGRRLLAGRTGRPVPEPEVGLDASFLQGVTQDRRAAPRRKGNTVEVQMAGGDGSTVRGWIVDRSQGGLGILVEQPVAEGTAFKVRPNGAASTVGWTDVTVRACRREGMQYELNCRFDRLPSWNDLLKFG